MSGYRAGSDIVGSLRRLRDRSHDIEPGGDRPLGARRLKESALSPNLNILALGRVVLAGVLCLAMPFRGRPSPVRRVRSRAHAARSCTATSSTSSNPGPLVLRRRGAVVRIHGDGRPHVRAGLLGGLGFVIRSSDPAILEFIRSSYEEVGFVGANGTWYVRRHPRLPSAG